MNINIARPNLGNPLILAPHELKRFQITVACQKPYKGEEEDVPYPSTTEILNRLRQDPPQIGWKNKNFALDIHRVHFKHKHPKFKDGYGSGKFADSAAKQQYNRGYRWDMRVDVGINGDQIKQLKDSFGWPTLLNIRYGRTNYHAIYVHETLGNSNEFTVLHITDTHISQRNDRILDLLCQVRNKRECEDLASRYVNFNGNLRAFIILANERVRSGENVIVVLTGDIVDYYFDGWWDGKFICGQGGGHAPDKRKEAPESKGSSWHYSNVSKFREIILGTDNKGEELLCPLFTILGNHDYYMNEFLLRFDIHLGPFKLKDQDTYDIFGLSHDEGREYDYWAFPRKSGKYRSLAERKKFKQNINKDNWSAKLGEYWSYWLVKPKQWALNQYIDTVNYDTDYKFSVGNHQFLCLNTGHERYPRFEEFLGIEHKEDADRDYIDGGPHMRGITDEHLEFIDKAMKSTTYKGLIFVFTHAPLLNLPKGRTEGIEILFEDKHGNAPTPPNDITNWLGTYVSQSWRWTKVKITIIGGYIRFPCLKSDALERYQGCRQAAYNFFKRKGYPQAGTTYFKRGSRYPFLNFSCADGEYLRFLLRVAPIIDLLLIKSYLY